MNDLKVLSGNFSLMEGRGDQLEALERVCDKRSKRGASCSDIISFLEGWKKRHGKNRLNASGADILIGYWTARKA